MRSCSRFVLGTSVLGFGVPSDADAMTELGLGMSEPAAAFVQALVLTWYALPALAGAVVAYQTRDLWLGLTGVAASGTLVAFTFATRLAAGLLAAAALGAVLLLRGPSAGHALGILMLVSGITTLVVWGLGFLPH